MSNIVKATAHPVSMDSKEIASLSNKEHGNVLRDMRVMLIDLYGDEYLNTHMPPNYTGGRNSYIQSNADAIFRALFEDDSVLNHQQYQGFTWKRDSRGYLTRISFDKSHTMTLVSGYDVKLRKRVVDRLEVLEKKLASQPKIAYTTGKTDTLTTDEQNQLRSLLTDAADALPKDSQGAFMKRGWSKLMAHFKVTYRKIPRSEFTEALAIASRHIAEYSAPSLPAPTATDKALLQAMDCMQVMASSVADLTSTVMHMTRGALPKPQKGEELNGGNRQLFGEDYAAATAKAS